MINLELVLILGGASNVFGDNPWLNNPVISIMIFYLPLALLILYGQKIQSWMMLNDISKSIGRLKEMNKELMSILNSFHSFKIKKIDRKDIVEEFGH